jgi:hypothetical protein
VRINISVGISDPAGQSLLPFPEQNSGCINSSASTISPSINHPKLNFQAICFPLFQYLLPLCRQRSELPLMYWMSG